MTHKPMHMKPEEDVISPQPDPAVSSFLQGTAERPGDLLKYYGAVQSSDVYGDHQGNLKDTKPNFPSDYTPEERRFLYGGAGISTILSDDRLSPGVKYRAAERMFKEMDNNELYEANSNALRTFMSMIPIAGTVGNLARTMNVYDSAKKIENNTATDVDYLVVAKEIEYQRRLAEESGASKAFRGFLGSLGFVGEFVASGGTAGLVKTGVTKITGKALQRGAQQVAKEATERAMANGIARVAIQGSVDDVAGATARQLIAQGVAKETAEKLAKDAAERATLHASQGLIKRSVREGTEMLGDTALRTVQPSFAPRIGESTTSRMTPEFDTESWTGKLVVEEGDHWMLALPKGIIDTGIEVLSEQLGEKFLPAVGKAISSSAGKMTSKVFPKRFKETFRQNLIDDLLKRSGRPVSQSSRNQILKTMGINGIISEFSEERMAEIMHGTAAAIYGEQGNFGMTGEVLSGEFGAAAESMAIEAPTLAAFQIPGIAASTTQQAREGRRKEAERRAEEQSRQRIRETIDLSQAVQIDPADRLKIQNEDPSRSVFESITVDIDGKKVPLSRLFTRQSDRQLVKRMLQDGKGLDEAIVSVRERIAEEGLAGDRRQQDEPVPPVTEPAPQQTVQPDLVETPVTEETQVPEEEVLSDEDIEGMETPELVFELERMGLKPTGDADNMRNQLREALRPPVEEAVEEDVQEPATQRTTPPPVPATPEVETVAPTAPEAEKTTVEQAPTAEDKSQVAYRTIRNMSHGLSNVSPPELLDHLPEGFRGTRQQENRPMTILLPEAFEKEKDADAQQKIADAYSSLIGDLENFEGASDAEIRAGLNRLLEDHGKPAGARRGVFTPMKDRDVLRIKPEDIRNEAIQGLNEAKKGKLHKTLMAMGNPISRVPATTEVAPKQAAKPVTGAKPELTRESVQAAIDGNHRNKEVIAVRIAAVEDGWFHEVKAKELTRSYKAGDKKYEFQLQGKKYVKNPDKWKDARPEQDAPETKPFSEAKDFEVYSSKSGDKTTYSVRTPDTRTREGLDYGVGDSVHDTLEEAQRHAEAERKRYEEKDAAEQKRAVEAEQEAEEKAEYDDIDGFMSDKTPAQQGRAKKYLNKKIAVEVGDKKVAKTIKEIIRDINDRGDLDVHAEKKGKRNVYYVQDKKDDSLRDLGKTGHDYALHLMESKPEQAAVKQQPAEEVEEVEVGKVSLGGKEFDSVLDSEDVKKIEDSPPEKCFENCFRAAESGETIIQGHVTDPESGKRFPHAWIVRGSKVFDPTAGLLISEATYNEKLNAEKEAEFEKLDYGIIMARLGSHGPYTKAEVEKQGKGKWLAPQPKKGDPAPKAEVKPEPKKGAKGESATLSRLTEAENTLLGDPEDLEQYRVNIDGNDYIVYPTEGDIWMMGRLDHLVDESWQQKEGGLVEFSDNSIPLAETLEESERMIRDMGVREDMTSEEQAEYEKDAKLNTQEYVDSILEEVGDTYDPDIGDDIEGLMAYAIQTNINAPHSPSRVKIDQIKRMFPGAEVYESEEQGGFVVKFDRGQFLVKAADEVIFPAAQIEKVYDSKRTARSIKNIKSGLAQAGGVFVHANDLPKARGINTLGMIILSERLYQARVPDTLMHEAVHLAHNNGLFSDAEWDQLLKASGSSRAASHKQQSESVAFWIQDQWIRRNKSKDSEVAREQRLEQIDEELKPLLKRLKEATNKKAKSNLRKKIGDLKRERRAFAHGGEGLFEKVVRKISEFFNRILKGMGVGGDSISRIYADMVSGNIFNRLNGTGLLDIKEYDIHERFGDELVSSPNALEAQFMHHFGTTEDYVSAKFLMPNGKYVNAPKGMMNSQQLKWEAPDKKVVMGGFIQIDVPAVVGDKPVQIKVANTILPAQAEAIRELRKKGHEFHVIKYSMKDYGHQESVHVLANDTQVDEFLDRYTGERLGWHRKQTKIERDNIYPSTEGIEDIAHLPKDELDAERREGDPANPLDGLRRIQQLVLDKGYYTPMSNRNVKKLGREAMDADYHGEKDRLYEKLLEKTNLITAVEAEQIQIIMQDLGDTNTREARIELHNWMGKRQEHLSEVARTLQYGRDYYMPEQLRRAMHLFDLLNMLTGSERGRLEKLVSESRLSEQVSEQLAERLQEELPDIPQRPEGTGHGRESGARKSGTGEGKGEGVKISGAKGEGTGTRKPKKTGKKDGGKGSKSEVKVPEKRKKEIDRLFERISKRQSKVRDKIEKHWGELTVERLEEIAESEFQTRRLVRDIMRAGSRWHKNISNFYQEYWYASILSGPTTHAVNIASNTIFHNIIRRPSKLISGYIDTLIDRLSSETVRSITINDKGQVKTYQKWLEENPERKREYNQTMQVIFGSAWSNAVAAFQSNLSLVEGKVTGEAGAGKYEDVTKYGSSSVISTFFDKYFSPGVDIGTLASVQEGGATSVPTYWKDSKNFMHRVLYGLMNGVDGTDAEINEKIRNLSSQLTQLKSSIAVEEQAIRDGIGDKDKLNKLNDNMAEKLNELANLKAERTIGQRYNGLSSIIQLPGKSLQAADDFFKTFFTRAAVGQYAAMLARVKVEEGDHGNADPERWKMEYIHNSMTNVNSEAWQLAMRDAKTSLFQSDPEDLKAQGRYIALAGMHLSAGVKNIPYIGWLINPFVRVPVNIAASSAEKIPGLGLAGLLPTYLNNKAEGQHWSTGMSENVAGQLWVLMLYYGITNLLAAMNDGDDEYVFTGASLTDDPKRRGFSYSEGVPQSTEMQIGGYRFDYGRIDPMATIFGIFRDMNEGKGSLGQNIVDGAIGAINDKTFMRGLQNVTDVFDSSRRDNVLVGFAASWIPNAYKQPARYWKDHIPDKRPIDSFWGKVLVASNLSDDAYPIYDMYGNRAVQAPGGGIAGVAYNSGVPMRFKGANMFKGHKIYVKYNDSLKREDPKSWPQKPHSFITDKSFKTEDNPTGRKDMSPSEYAEFSMKYGELFRRAVEVLLPPEVAENPTKTDLEIMDRIRTKSREMIKDAYIRGILNIVSPEDYLQWVINNTRDSIAGTRGTIANYYNRRQKLEYHRWNDAWKRWRGYDGT